MIYPPKIKRGDAIAIFAPSLQMTDSLELQYSRGMDVLLGFGFEVLEYNYCKNGEEKAHNIHEYFSNKNVKALVALQGGDSCEEILSYLDFELIAANPKIVMGFSDVSVLLNAIAHQSQLITFLGPDLLWKFGGEFSEYDKKEFLDILTHGRKKIIPNSKWQFLKKSTKKPFEGRLWGGNIRCFMKLFDTEYLPDFNNGVLMFEELGKNIDWYNQILDIMYDSGILEQLNGIIIGKNYKSIPNELAIDHLIVEKVDSFKLDLNIMKINEFGHKSDHSIFPIGAKVSVTATSINWDVA